MTTLVSIILPCYNRASYIEKCVKSVLAQTYTNIECILVDDGSKDNTREIAEKLMVDSRVKYFYKENGGLSSARNFGIEKARGEWIQCLDPDDWIHEDKTRFQLSYLELDNQSNQNVVFYCDYERVFLDNDQNILRREPNIIGSLTRDQLIQRLLLPDFLAKSPFPVLQQCMLIKKELLSKKFDSSLKALQDRDFALELLSEGVDFIYTPIVGAYYTKHETNMSSNWEYMKNDYVLFYEIESRKNTDFCKYSEPGVKYWLEQTLIEKDRKNFFRLALIANYPVTLFDGLFKVNNKFGYLLAYFLRMLLPESLLYKHSRGPRSQKIFDIFLMVFRFART